MAEAGPVRHPATAFSRAALLGGLLALAACFGDDTYSPPAVHVTGIEILAGDVVLELMDSVRIPTRVRTTTGVTTQRRIDWHCEPALARTCGPFIQPRDTGDMRLIARIDGFADTIRVRIYEEGMSDLVITEPFPFTPTPLLEGVPLLIKLEVTDSAGAKRDERRVVWRSADTTVAVVRDTTWWTGAAWWPAGLLETRGPGRVALTAAVGGLAASLEVVVRPRAASCSGTVLSLDLEVGELRRFRGTDPGLPGCLEYRAARDAGRRYLVLAERLPLETGSHQPGRRGLFHVAGGGDPPDSLVVQIYTPAAVLAAAPTALAAPAEHVSGRVRWLVGGRAVHEAAPDPAPAVAAVRRAVPAGAGVASSAVMAPGDTLVVPRLGTLAGDAQWQGPGERSDRAVVRYVGDNLVVAEHVEVFDTRLRRWDGRAGAPIPAEEYARIDAAFRAGRVQLERLFGPSPTAAALGLPPGRELVINAIHPRGMWGTAGGDAAFIDYWSGTDGVTPSLLQDPLFLANQLIAHELAHVRHYQHQPEGPLLNWVIEGVARFVEHLAFAATVMGSDSPSRTGNVVAGPAGYPTMPGTRSAAELPSAVGLETSFFGGYGGSAYVLDYLVDHVTADGGDGLAAARDVILSLHDRSAADAAVARVLGPVTFDELVSRARLALVLDDLPTAAALPSWTQYLQYDTRASRPWSLNWPQLVPGLPFAASRQLSEGVVWGVLIDGDRAVGDQDLVLDVSRGPQAVVSIVRIQ